MPFRAGNSSARSIANRALCKFYGKTESEIIGKTDFDLMDENGARACRKTDEQTLLSNALLITEEVVRDALRQMLELFGYTVVCKNDGRESVDFYRNEISAKRHYVAMFFDLTIPGGMGGIDAIREVRTINMKIPVFVASGYADDPVMNNPAHFGFTASISKPFSIAALSEMLNKNLINCRPERY
jgi:CheY-like chemotaxis protein